MCLFALSFAAISSGVFAHTPNRYQRSNIAQQDVQKPADNLPAIPNSLIPPKNQVQSAARDEKTLASLTIVQILSEDSSFSNLNKALKSAGLLDTLSGPGPFTLFAPNDQAFAKLSPNALADLLNPNNKEKLTTLLTYHVVPGKITEEQLKTMKIRTLQGKPIDVQVAGDKKTVNQAKIVGSQAVGSNGVIYVIDTVLNP